MSSTSTGTCTSFVELANWIYTKLCYLLMLFFRLDKNYVLWKVYLPNSMKLVNHNGLNRLQVGDRHFMCKFPVFEIFEV